MTTSYKLFVSWNNEWPVKRDKSLKGLKGKLGQGYQGYSKVGL